MLTEEQLSVLAPLIAALLAELNALVAELVVDADALTTASSAAIARLAAGTLDKLAAIEAFFPSHGTAPQVIPRQRPVASALAVHTQLILRYLPNAQRYASEMLELTDDLIAGQRCLDREARASLRDRCQDIGMAILGVEMQLYRLPGCRGRIIFDSNFRLDGECSSNRCFCNDTSD